MKPETSGFPLRHDYMFQTFSLFCMILFSTALSGNNEEISI